MQLHIIRKTGPGFEYIRRWTLSAIALIQIVQEIIDILSCAAHVKNTTKRGVEFDEFHSG
jgi:hypothetical protein